ncbi:iron chelate uptake ABC transporter family permease subunit [Desulfosediminicola ganghwensis]|uniref:metal ABC transporter permease n=1 Tax=Desulfosediminicola ganghwensis TaxID=2569540 RepID=UPI0010AD02A9|nr:iron chelate uptake ABC transporter family permease subunit [Desulfosediminicola ganghwensis]
MLDAFLAPLQETYFQKALIGGSIVAVVAGVVGCLVVLRRMAFLGDALSHAMIAGVAGGYLVMKMFFGLEAHAPGMLLGSLIAAIATVALISFVSRVSRIKEDTTIGIMYTGIFALGVVAVSVFRHYIHIDLMHFIMGDILGVADTDLWVSAFTAAIVLTIIILFFRHFQIATFDPVMAASIGLPVLLLDYLLTICVSLVVVSAVSMVGVILVVGLLITPAATAYLLSDRLDRMMVLAGIFGVTSVIGGLYLCVWLDSAGGGAVMLFCTLQFLVVLAVAPKYGLLARWLRLKRLVPQQVVEDVLTTILRHGKATSLPVIRTYVESGQGGLRKALKRMIQDGLIAEEVEGYVLTAEGRKEADKVLRAHRLWEAYLERIGTPKEELHTTAHQLEHIGDAAEYLDERLGKTKKDPHGQVIPEPR